MTITEAIFLLIIGIIIAYFSFVYKDTTPKPLEFDYTAWAKRQVEDYKFIRRAERGEKYKKTWLGKR